MVQTIKTAKDIVKRDGCMSVEEWIRRLATRRHIAVRDIDDKFPVVARIDHSRWIADCDCGGAEYVDPDETIFFCFSCNNVAFNGKIRTVTFPLKEKLEEIYSGLGEQNNFSWTEGGE